MQPEGKKYEINTAEIVSGVMDLFPGADRQALTCLAELLEKRIAELTAERDKARRYCSVAAYDMAGFAKTLKARPEAFPHTAHDLMETSEFMQLAGEGREDGTVYEDELSKEKARVKVLEEALQKIERVPAWGFPGRWDVTPAEVRTLARAALFHARDEMK